MIRANMSGTELELSIKQLPAGRYIVAVSGGVDSMALLHMLQKQPRLQLIVAHFNHGIRSDACQDQKLVEMYTMSHNIQFTYEAQTLGERASEATARKARYDFLRRTCKKYNALGIILAHHQDDLLETALINLLRGTGRRGLHALRSHDDLIRPLLGISKAQIVAYATANAIPWREDITNQDPRYLRNYVRHQILARAGATNKNELLSIIVRHSIVNQAIEEELEHWLVQYSAVSGDSITLPRYQMIMLPGPVAYELLQYCIKRRTGSTLEKQLAQRALLFVKTARIHKRFTLGAAWQVRIGRRIIIVEPKGRMIS